MDKRKHIEALPSAEEPRNCAYLGWETRMHAKCAGRQSILKIVHSPDTPWMGIFLGGMVVPRAGTSLEEKQQSGAQQKRVLGKKLLCQGLLCQLAEEQHVHEPLRAKPHPVRHKAGSRPDQASPFPGGWKKGLTCSIRSLGATPVHGILLRGATTGGLAKPAPEKKSRSWGA